MGKEKEQSGQKMMRLFYMYFDGFYSCKIDIITCKNLET